MMAADPDEHELMTTLRREVAHWSPGAGPNLRDLVHRAERPWRAPVALASAVAVAALTLVFLIAVVVTVLGPAIPGGEEVRAHLVGPW